MKLRFHDRVTIVLCGAAGQGIQTVEHILMETVRLSGYHVFSTDEYMSRIRGGSNSTLIRISSKRVLAPVERIDILVPFSKGAIPHLQDRISPDTVVLGDKTVYGDEYRGDNAIDVPLSKIASQVGGPIYVNTIAAALLAGLLNAERETLENYLRRHFSGKSESVIQKNLEAAGKGYELQEELRRKGTIQIDIARDDSVKGEISVDGVEALAMGAVAGGCNFLAFYPMSPSTSVAEILAGRSADFGIVVEQAEDEIAAINMG
ncbi:MAG TPA: 2-oxoacid:acceptor oxidoreductase family protein, partial [Thermodesulfobacteriota bacterium]|nr:2-oxoacid:acceptor oxidoreductase family protein [Thermodesulfobacteriota bacterium]